MSVLSDNEIFFINFLRIFDVAVFVSGQLDKIFVFILLEYLIWR